jgi:hypothetical protein
MQKEITLMHSQGYFYSFDLPEQVHSNVFEREWKHVPSPTVATPVGQQ